MNFNATRIKARLAQLSWAMLMAALVLYAVGAARAEEPRYFAIRNAHIVPVSGPEIRRGTVVIAKGLIVAVGEKVTIPPEAWVVEGRGLTVYPGFIDPLSDLGLGGGAPAGALLAGGTAKGGREIRFLPRGRGLAQGRVEGCQEGDRCGHGSRCRAARIHTQPR